ncbi:MAG: hypothetical protein WAT66_03395 [Actinomycetota bacterium]
MRSPRALLALLLLLLAAGVPAVGGPRPCRQGWTKVGEEEFGAPFVLLRSQGVTHDDTGWIFSWQGGLERTTPTYTTQALATWPYDDVYQPSFDLDGTNHFGGTHIGDVDTIDGLIYAPLEDGEFDVGITTLNVPEYQQSFIELYDAKTLLYTGVRYPVPHELSRDGVPWIAIDKTKREAYTGEWNMPTDTFNVFDLKMNVKRVLRLRYPDSFGTGFHLSRIQGGDIAGRTMYVARDDAQQTIYGIDLVTGHVTPLFTMEWPEPSELEGIAVHPTPDGALVHVLLIKDNDLDDPRNLNKVRTSFQHFAPVCA